MSYSAKVHDTADGAPADEIDLSAYLNRIGYTGSLAPTLAVLTSIVERHMAAIPFETIDVIRHRSVDLKPAAIDEKMIARGRGGYCFEHASLLRRALLALGFPVEQHLARVWRHDNAPETVPAATHTSLKVGADGRLWLVDTGFVDWPANTPLPWLADRPYTTAFGSCRLVGTRDGYMLESWRRDVWAPLYEILDFHWQPADFEVANDYVVRNPCAGLASEFVVAATHGDTRHTLIGNLLRIEVAGARCHERRLDRSELTAALAELFGLPTSDDWQPLIAGVIAAAGRARHGPSGCPPQAAFDPM